MCTLPPALVGNEVFASLAQLMQQQLHLRISLERSPQLQGFLPDSFGLFLPAHAHDPFPFPGLPFLFSAVSGPTLPVPLSSQR